mgnify:CR=1 FL=1
MRIIALAYIKFSLKIWQNVFLIYGTISVVSLFVFVRLATNPTSSAAKSALTIYICSLFVILFKLLALQKYNPARVENKKIVLDKKKLLVNILVSSVAFFLIVVVPYLVIH